MMLSKLIKDLTELLTELGDAPVMIEHGKPFEKHEVTVVGSTYHNTQLVGHFILGKK